MDDGTLHPEGFELLAPVGQGGMARVWQARHRHSGLVVAVKIARPQQRPAAVLSLFAREVRALARLDHPRIVPLLEHGVLGSTPACPWLAMAWMAGGSLRRQPPQDWAQVRAVLDAVLEGLAWAHAHGILHRDIKPDNILCAEAGGRWALADFGIAHTLNSDDLAQGWGTPSYMAPEQRTGGVLGPWTDIFAVGCLAVELVWGAVVLPLPALALARLDAPATLQRWLQGCLHPDPRRRFACAADARAALWTLPDAAPRPPSAVLPSQGRTTPQSWAEGRDSTIQETDSTPAGVWGMVPPEPEPAEPLWPPAPLPESPPMLPGSPLGPLRRTMRAGLSLVGLAPTPLVGRGTERAALWEALRARHRAPGCTLLALEGVEGSGRSRLGQWLCRSAHATGAAVVIEAGAAGLRAALLLAAQGHGTPDTLAAEGGAWIQAAQALLSRLGQQRPVLLWLDEAHTDPLTVSLLSALRADASQRILVLLAAADGQALPVGTTRLPVPSLPPAERRRFVENILGLAPDLALRIDALSGGLPGLAEALVRALADTGQLIEAPEGFVLRDGELRLPDDLRQAARLRLDTLVPPDQQAPLVLAALGGERFSRATWAAACQAAHLPDPEAALEPLLAAGLLAEAEDGDGLAFQDAALRSLLAEEAAAAPPRAAWHAAWADSLPPEAPYSEHARHRLGAGRWRAALPAILRAADYAGREFDFAASAWWAEQYTQAADAAGLDPDDPLRGEPLHFQIAAQKNLRTPGLLELCDRLLARARAAGWAKAEALLLHERETMHHSPPVQALACFDRAIELLDGIATPAPADPWEASQLVLRRLSLYGQRGEVLLQLGRVEAAMDDARRAIDVAVGRPNLEAWAQFQLAVLLRMQGRFPEALAALEQVFAFTRRNPHRYTLHREALLCLGTIHHLCGRHDEAAATFEEAAAISRRGSLDGAVVPLINLYIVRAQQRQLAPYRADIQRLRVHDSVVGMPLVIAIVELLSALAAQEAGSPDAAAQDYAAAIQRIDTHGLVDQDLAVLLQILSTHPSPSAEAARQRAVAMFTALGDLAAAARCQAPT